MYAQISSITKQYTPQLQQRAGFFFFKALLLLMITLSGAGPAKATETAAGHEMRAALPQLPGIVIEASEQWEVIKLSEKIGRASCREKVKSRGGAGGRNRER